MTQGPVIGRFDSELFDRFRAMPPGAVRRALHGRLILENEPLVKVLVAQLLGRETVQRRRPGKRTSLGGLKAPELIDWDDAMQAGRIGMSKALDRFDPTKGKLSLYALHKIRYELQCVEEKNSVIHVPRGRQDMAPKGFDFIEDLGGEAMLEDMSGTDQDDVVERDFKPANDVDDSPSFAPTIAANEVEKEEPLAPLERFLSTRCAFLPPARVAREALVCAYERTLRALGERVRLAPLLDALKDRGAKLTTMRVDWARHPVQAFARVRLRTTASWRNNG